MKKLLTVLSLLALAGLALTACESSDRGDKLDVDEGETEYDLLEWETFESEEMGISFGYPEGTEVSTDMELADFDEGVMRVAQVLDEDGNLVFKISMTSADFEQGISEGCCWFYSGEAIDLDMEDDELLELLNESFLTAYNLERTEVADEDAISFTRESKYVSTVISKTYLLPYSYEEFSNVLITGPDFSKDGKGAMSLFDDILYTLEFLD